MAARPVQRHLGPPGRRAGRLSALLAATAIGAALAFPGTAGATGEKVYGAVKIVSDTTGGEVIVGGEPRTCGVAFVFDLSFASGLVPVVGWKVKTWASDPFAGTTVLKSQDGPTDANGVLRQPLGGYLSLPNGRYNVIWDNEYPPDSSAGVRSFTVNCSSAPTTTLPPTDSAAIVGFVPAGDILGDVLAVLATASLAAIGIARRRARS